jgi:hypothetical protein
VGENHTLTIEFRTIGYAVSAKARAVWYFSCIGKDLVVWGWEEGGV